jgi:ABC-type antimicrobial peptide transport system permease subunit
VRTTGDPGRVSNAVRQAVRSIDPTVPVSQIRTMSEVMGDAESQPRFLALMLSLFSTLALVLAGFGIYGVISYSVARRTSEFGIRMALGAERGDVFSLVLTEGAILAGLGVIAGLAGAALLSGFLEGLLFQVNRFDPITFAGMAAILVVASLLACWLPARRATAVDPIRALRYE